MAKYSFKCRDVGMDCDFEVRGASSAEEVAEAAKAHAKLTHGLESIPPELAEKVKQAIKEEK